MTVAPDSGIGFAELSHSAEISEDAEEGTLIKTLSLVQKDSLQKGLRVQCDVTTVTDARGEKVKRGE